MFYWLKNFDLKHLLLLDSRQGYFKRDLEMALYSKDKEAKFILVTEKL